MRFQSGKKLSHTTIVEVKRGKCQAYTQINSKCSDGKQIAMELRYKKQQSPPAPSPPKSKWNNKIAAEGFRQPETYTIFK
jgi:hypothetical protein